MWLLSTRSARRGSDSCAGRRPARLALEALEDRHFLSAGALDLTFGGQNTGNDSPAGTVFGGSTSGGLLVYPNTGVNPSTDGKIVVAAVRNGNTFVERYNPNGSVDNGFGTGGAASTEGIELRYLALQSDGKILAAGHVFDGTAPARSFAVARYLDSGQLDPSFGSGGIVVTHLAGAPVVQEAWTIAIQGEGPNEKIYVAGPARLEIDDKVHITLLRYDAHGNLDPTFANDGVAVTPNFPSAAAAGRKSYNHPLSLAVQSDGKVVLAGVTGTSAADGTFVDQQMAVVRYTVSGALDSTFSGDGIVTLTANSTSSRATGVLIQNSGAIVLSGESRVGPNGEQRLALARLTPSGDLDPTFGNGGYAFGSTYSTGNNIVQAANGDLLAGGSVGSGIDSDLAVVAFLPDGTPDSTFGDGGVSVVAIPGREEIGRTIALQSDGKIVATGYSRAEFGSTLISILARFLPPEFNEAVSPTVTGVAPFSGPTTGGTTVVITGSGFTVGQTTVTFGGIEAVNVTVNSATQITATTPSFAAPGVVDVVVTTPAGSSSADGADNDFTYSDAPTVNSLVVNGGDMFARNAYGVQVAGLAGNHSILEQLYVTFDVGVTLADGAFSLDAGPVSVNIAGAVNPVPVGNNVVNIIVESDPVTLDNNGGYKGFRLRFNGSSTYLNNFDNSQTGNGGSGNIFTTLKDGFYKLNIVGANVHAGNSVAGTPMVGDTVQSFWTMYGSSSADDRVISATLGDGTSFISVNSSLLDFSKTNGNGFGAGNLADYNANFDWNLDGDVGDDLIEFAKRFGAEWTF